MEEIRGLEWKIDLTTDAAKAYRDDLGKRKELGEKIGKFTRFFRRPDPDFWNFDSFLNAFLEEIFVYDALSIIFRPKFGASFGMGGRGLLGSDLDSLRLISGPTIRPLIDLHGGKPVPPAPAYQQFLYGVPRSDYMTIAMGTDIDDAGLLGAEVNDFNADIMLYAPYWATRETPYGFPPVERALLPIIAGLQKQEFQLDFFSEGSVPAVYISPGDNNISPTQISELQSALNAIAGDPAYHLKVVVLPPGSKVEPQKPIDLSDGFDLLVQTQVCCVPGTEVITKRGLVKIEDIRRGDIVLTHRGNWRPVLKRMINPVHEPVRRIKANGFDALEVTGNHPVHSAHYNQTAAHRQVLDEARWVAARDLLPKRSRGEFDAQTLPVPAFGPIGGSLRIADHVKGNRYHVCENNDRLEHGRSDVHSLPAQVPFDAAFGRLLGFYMAEGSSCNGEIAWYFNENETTYHEQVITDLMAVFGVPAKLRHRPEHHVTAVECQNAMLAELFSCGTAKNKHLPEWAWKGSREFFGQLLWAWVAGDGNLTQKGWRGRTASRTLAWQMRLVALMCGLKPQLRRDRQPASFIQGREISRGEIYTVEVILDPQRPGTYRVETEGTDAFLTSPVRLNEPSSYDGDVVYNLEIEGDNSYVTTGGTVHNCMAFDVQPIELGILPNIGSAGTGGGANASAVRAAGQEARDIKSRKSTKPLLKFICDIFNYVIQDICKEPDLQFSFEGLVDDDDKQQITELGVQQVQNAISSIDEIRERLDLPPWGLNETQEPVVFTAQGPIPLSMAPQLIAAAMQGPAGGQGTNSGQKTGNTSSSTSRQPRVRQGGQTKPNGSHPAPITGHRENPTGAHAAASGAVQSPTPRTGGTTSRSSVAGSRKKAVDSELEALKRHLRKGRSITTWEPFNIGNGALGMIAEDIAKGVLLDTAIERARDISLRDEEFITRRMGSGGSGDSVIARDELRTRQFPGWERDLGLVGAYTEEISQAFQDAEIRGRELRAKAASGNMFVSAGTLHGLISDTIKDTFLKTMTPLWEKGWSLGYESAVQVMGTTATRSNPSALQGFLDTEGTHWLEQIARTGLGNSNARSEVIARTEVARAMNAAAIQAYRDNGVQYKHLLVAPDDLCDICVAAKEEGDIPLDAIFPGGGLGGPFHPNCRCMPAPSGFTAEPPQAHIGKRYITEDEARKKAREDPDRLGWLLLRAKDEDGKYRFLLQQRNDGTWGMPGGGLHVGEDPWLGALRETEEEIGDLPVQLECVGTFHHLEEGQKIQAYVYLCDVPYFSPAMNGSTPEETQGAAWFRKKEVGHLNLTPKFKDDWEDSVHLKDNATKSLQRMATENGEIVVREPYGAGTGSNWPYPRRSDGSPALDGPDGRPVPQNNRPGGGQVQGEMGAIEPPFIQDDLSSRVSGSVYPRGSNDESQPRRRGKGTPARKLPHGPGEQWPEHEQPDSPGIGAQIVPGGNIKQSMKPVTGSVPAQAPKPYSPRAGQPEVFDPADTVEQLTEEGNVSPPPQKK
jgi:8-oxo-dGTP pyrophosphatase MutT (NUDIX family)